LGPGFWGWAGFSCVGCFGLCCFCVVGFGVGGFFVFGGWVFFFFFIFFFCWLGGVGVGGLGGGFRVFGWVVVLGGVGVVFDAEGSTVTVLPSPFTISSIGAFTFLRSFCPPSQLEW